jgi:hypothetical protein
MAIVKARDLYYGWVYNSPAQAGRTAYMAVL